MRSTPWLLATALLASACPDQQERPLPQPPTLTAVPTLTAPPSAEDPDAFRAKAPASGPAVQFNPPKIEEAKLANGLRVLVVTQRKLPIVAISISLNEGVSWAAPGVGALAVATMARGTKKRSAIQLSDELTSLGANWDVGADYDGVQISGKCMSDKLPEVLAVLADVALNPAFARQELDKARSRTLTSIEQDNDRPTSILAKTTAQVLYPSTSSYHLPISGDVAAVKKVSVKDLQEFHKARFNPSHTTVSLVGDIDKAKAVELVEKLFGSWKETPRAKPIKIMSRDADQARIVIVDRPGATQSWVNVATVGAARDDPDFDALMVMNTILGGQFSSRLNLNLREKNAYSYGVRSGFDFRHRAGPFTAGGAIAGEKTAPAIKEILTELRRIAEDPVTDEELADAKTNLIKQLPSRFETVSATAGTLAVIATYGLPLDEFATRPARIQKITKDDVRRVARSHLPPMDSAVIVIVGDAKAITPGLEALELGAIRVIEAAKPANKKQEPPKKGGSK